MPPPSDPVLAQLHSDIEGETDRTRYPPAVPTRQEIRAILDEAASDPRVALIIRLLYATGMRRGELAELCYPNLLWGEKQIFISEGKGVFDRYVLVDSETLRQLGAWRESQSGEASVFNVTGGQITRLVNALLLRTPFYAAYDAQKLTLSCHSFRHAFATHCYENGMDVFTLRRLLGHERFETTTEYLGTARPDLCSAYHKCFGHDLSNGLR